MHSRGGKRLDKDPAGPRVLEGLTCRQDDILTVPIPGDPQRALHTRNDDATLFDREQSTRLHFLHHPSYPLEHRCLL
jgi:hypothetical protein